MSATARIKAFFLAHPTRSKVEPIGWAMFLQEGALVQNGLEDERLSRLENRFLAKRYCWSNTSLLIAFTSGSSKIADLMTCWNSSHTSKLDGASDKYSEGYYEYVGYVNDAVMKIADAEPGRADAWRALLGIEAGPGDGAYGRWLGTHGDKAIPYLLAYAADRLADAWDKHNRTDALESLAQIAAYEERPDTAHHLSPKDLETVEALVRGEIGNADIGVRRATITALGIMADAQDLAALDRVALTDEYVITNGGRSGADIRFPLREYARDVAAAARARLAARKTSAQ